MRAPSAGNRSQWDRSTGHTARTSGYTGTTCLPTAKRSAPLMTHHSEERLPETEGAPSVRAGARILPFERPQSELQRAIQQRAQDALDRDAELDREKRRPQPVKWLTIFALACIPVLLTIVAVDGFLRVFHKVADMYSSPPQQEQAQPAETESNSSPGIVMLQSYETPSATQRSDSAPAASPPPKDAPPSR
jgi:hypothetical protein